jgi:hypothetical protein
MRRFVTVGSPTSLADIFSSRSRLRLRVEDRAIGLRKMELSSDPTAEDGEEAVIAAARGPPAKVLFWYVKSSF